MLFMCASMLGFTLNDTLMKATTQSLPLFETIFLRGLGATLGLVVIAMLTPRVSTLRLSGPDRRIVLWRTAGDVVSTALFLVALMHMPLANLSAIMQALPLAVTLAAAVFMGDTVGWRRMSAIVVGLAGVLIIIRPGAAAFDGWSMMGLGSMLAVVLRDLATRKLSPALPSVVPAVWGSAAVMLMGLAGAPLQGIRIPTLTEVLLTQAAAGFLIIGYLSAIKAMRVGDLSLVAPFRYTSLLWAILLGWLLFGTLPDGPTILGAGIVVASGIYILLRQRRLSAPAVRA